MFECASKEEKRVCKTLLHDPIFMLSSV